MRELQAALVRPVITRKGVFHPSSSLTQDPKDNRVMAIAKNSPNETVQIIELRYDTIRVDLIGTSPLLQHRFSAKARRELLLPGRKKNRAGLAASLKHDPVNEFRECLYRNRDAATPSLFHVPGGMFRQAIAAAALDMPGDARKTEILRWIAIDDAQINLFGVPKLHMAMVRSSGMTRTPDVRTRPCFERWACTLKISFPSGKITASGLVALLGGAGQLCGIGDWRPQKGGDFGRFRVVDAQTKPAFEAIVKEQARAAQSEAWASPEIMDEDTAELLTWFKTEIEDREMSGAPDAYADGELAEEEVV
jgi:hypothetical protein